MERCFIFQLRGGGVFFKWGASFLSGGGGAPWGGINFDMGGFEKNCRMWGRAPPPPCPPLTMGNPEKGGQPRLKRHLLFMR